MGCFQMKVKFFKNILRNGGKVSFLLPEKKYFPGHFHVTEVAKVTKNCVDCGGESRQFNFVTLQLWLGDDFDHRINSQTMKNIMENIESCCDEWDIKVELDSGTIGLYDIGEVILYANQINNSNKTGYGNENITFQLERTYTNCLAPQKCGLKNQRACGDSCY